MYGVPSTRDLYICRALPATKFMWQLLAIISALFSAAAAVFEKKALFKNDALAFSLMVSAITFVFTAPFFFFIDIEMITSSAVIVLLIKSFLGSAAFLLVMKGLKHNELSNSLPLLVFTPAIVAILAFFILGEAISWMEIGGMTLLLAGTYVLQLEKSGSWLSPFRFVQRHKAQWYIIGAIVLFSTTSTLDKTLLKGYKLQPEAFLPLQQLFYTFFFMVAFIARKGIQKPLKKQFKETWKLIFAVAVFAVIYRYSHILAIKAGSVALVLSIKRTSVFFATIFGGRYFREHNIFRRSIAVFVMVTGAVLIILA